MEKAEYFESLNLYANAGVAYKDAGDTKASQATWLKEAHRRERFLEDGSTAADVAQAYENAGDMRAAATYYLISGYKGNALNVLREIPASEHVDLVNEATALAVQYAEKARRDGATYILAAHEKKQAIADRVHFFSSRVSDIASSFEEVKPRLIKKPDTKS